MRNDIQRAINEQIRIEYQSAYLYLAYAARFDEMNFKGCSNWMRIQWQEELMHGTKLFDFLLRRGGSVELQEISKPVATFTTPIEAFESVLEHEQFVTRSIHKLYGMAEEAHDYALKTLMHWYIDEQVEEEDNARSIVDDLKLAGNSAQILFMLDRELGQRQPGVDIEAEA